MKIITGLLLFEYHCPHCGGKVLSPLYGPKILCEDCNKEFSTEPKRACLFIEDSGYFVNFKVIREVMGLGESNKELETWTEHSPLKQVN